MSTSAPTGDQGSSTRPYLIRALHEWCTDNGFTPYLAVYVDGAVQVPMEYVKNNEIVLNVGFDATHGLSLGNETVEFKARFGGVSREIMVPVDHVVAIYARENGQGMAFPVPTATSADADAPVLAQEPTPRGLRLAPVEDSTEASARPPVPRAGWSDEQDPGPPPEPPSTPSGGSRPALKRIK
jgi:stringent starvation protein B